MARTAFTLFFAGLVSLGMFTDARVKMLPSSSIKVTRSAAAVECSACVNMFEDSLGTLLDIIINGGVIGSCEALCSHVKKPWEVATCTLLCAGLGIDGFIHFLQSHDEDPVYLCTDLKVCPRNNCSSNCLTISSAYVTPSSGPVRTTFHVVANLTVFQLTGTGITQVIVTPPGPVNETNPFGAAILNEGFQPGQVSVEIPIKTDEFDWQFKDGVYGVEIDSCGSDCNDKYGVVFDTAFTNFSISK